MSKLLRRFHDTKLHEAIYNGDVQKVKYHLDKETNVNVPNGDGYSAFHAGCVQQNLQIIDLLLQNPYMNVDTKLKTRTGDSALFLVLTGYCDRRTADVVKRLIDYDIELVEMADARGFTPVQAAARWEQLDVLQVLLEQGKAEVNRRDLEGWTALHHSAEVRPNLSVMNYLVNVAKIDVSVRNSADMTGFDLLLHHHMDAGQVPDSYLHCVDLLSGVCLHRKDCHSFSTVLSYFLHCIIFDRRPLISKIIAEFYNEKVNEKAAVLANFIKTFRVEEHTMYYAFCMVLNKRINEVRQFNFRHFTGIFPEILREALQSNEKLEAVIDCLRTIREVLPNSDKHILPTIAEFEYDPCSFADIKRLFRLYECLIELDYKVDFNGVASRHFLNVLSTGSIRSIKHLEIILAFCTDNFIRLNRFCYTFNMQLDNETRFLTYEADLPLEMKGPEYLPTLKEIARKVVRSCIYDKLLADGNRMSLPPDLYYKNKYYVESIRSLCLPVVLQRYLRFMDRLPL